MDNYWHVKILNVHYLKELAIKQSESPFLLKNLYIYIYVYFFTFAEPKGKAMHQN